MCLTTFIFSGREELVHLGRHNGRCNKARDTNFEQSTLLFRMAPVVLLGACSSATVSYYCLLPIDQHLTN